MKKLIIVALIIFAKSAYAQKDTIGLNVPFVNSTVVFERVFDVPNTPKSVLYANAGLWMAETHPYVQDTQLQLADPALSRVTGRIKASDVVQTDKVLWQTQYGTITFYFTMQIDCKDNKYRARIFNIQDVSGSEYIPVDNLMQALINSKPYTVNTIFVLKTANIKVQFQALNAIVKNVFDDIAKNMPADNSF